MSTRDRAILGRRDLEPYYEIQNPVWNCSICGRFTSARLGPHPDCERISWEDEMAAERRESYYS